jgi:tetrahydromethanopterin S-methyltransferase subunit H
MLKFAQPQRVCKIGNVLVGGQPGENPTVLCGSIFFRGHRIVSDPEEGVFDREKAKDLLDREGELSAETGIPRMIDVLGETTKALIQYIEFVATYCDAPILVDSSVPRVRMEAIRYFANTEVACRLVYNSLDEHYTAEELACIRDSGIKSAVILAFGSKTGWPKDRVKLLKDGLVDAAESAGLENLLIDTGVLDVPSISWSAQAIYAVKEELGYPSGCAPANALYMWEKLKVRGSPDFQAVVSAVLALPISWGADFIFYGPIRNASWVYPACAAVEAMVAYGGRPIGIRPAKGHPLYRIF